MQVKAALEALNPNEVYIYPFIYLYLYIYIYLYLSIYLSIYLFIYLSIYIYVYIYTTRARTHTHTLGRRLGNLSRAQVRMQVSPPLIYIHHTLTPIHPPTPTLFTESPSRRVTLLLYTLHQPSIHTRPSPRIHRRFIIQRGHGHTRTGN